MKFPKRHPHVYQFETGYALVQGTWVRHSWAFDCRTNQIVETTVLRDKYFGLTHQPPAAVQELPPDDGGLVLPEVRSQRSADNCAQLHILTQRTSVTGQKSQTKRWSGQVSDLDRYYAQMESAPRCASPFMATLLARRRTNQKTRRKRPSI